jgi:cytochrome P450
MSRSPRRIRLRRRHHRGTSLVVTISQRCNKRRSPTLPSSLTTALRMRPPVPSGLQRVAPKGGAFINGQYIPEQVSPMVKLTQTTVSSSLHVLQNDPANFGFPDEFIPERWLPSTPVGVFNKSAFVAFSAGHRQCLGKK